MLYSSKSRLEGFWGIPMCKREKVAYSQRYLSNDLLGSQIPQFLKFLRLFLR